MHEALQGALVAAPGLGEAARSALLANGVELRRARDRRLYPADDETTAIKWASVTIPGIAKGVPWEVPVRRPRRSAPDGRRSRR